MTKTQFLKRAGIAVLVLLVFFLLRTIHRSESDDANKRPAPSSYNVFLVTVDTTRADQTGPYGHPYVATPALDRLAREGITFKHAIAPSQCTNASHASMLTGLYPSRHGVYDNATPMPDEAVSLARILRERGYLTVAAVSARHLNDSNSNFGKGFDYFLSCPFNELNARDRNVGLFKLLDRHYRENLFVWVHYFDPHGGYNPPSPYNIMYPVENRFDPLIPDNFTDLGYGKEKVEIDPDHIIPLYQGEISFMDFHLGNLLRKIDQYGIAERTLVVVVGDHGESLTEHELYFCHWGMYREVLSVPLIMRFPDRLPAGRVVTAPVSGVDIMPTILDLVGVDAESEDIDGVGLAPMIEYPDTMLHRHIFSEGAREMGRAVFTEDMQFTKYYAEPGQVAQPPELYRYLDDPAQEVNLVEEFPEDAEALERVLDEWVSAQGMKRLEPAAPREVDPEMKKALKALGYLD